MAPGLGLPVTVYKNIFTLLCIAHHYTFTLIITIPLRPSRHDHTSLDPQSTIALQLDISNCIFHFTSMNEHLYQPYPCSLIFPEIIENKTLFSFVIRITNQ